MKYLIWSYRRHQWWGSERCGYTPDSLMAGQYDQDEAASVVFGSLPGQQVAVDINLADRFIGSTAEAVELELAHWRDL